jgi:hypothetical protein
MTVYIVPIKTINTRYPGREVHIEVSEDGENGAVLCWKPLISPGATVA